MFDAAAFGRPTVTTAHVPMADFCLENKLGVVASFDDQTRSQMQSRKRMKWT